MHPLRRQAFTLVEMLVVLTILSILMLTVVVSVARVMERGQEAQIEAQMSQLKAAAQLAQADGVSDFSQEQLINKGYLHQAITPPLKDRRYVIHAQNGFIEVTLEKRDGS